MKYLHVTHENEVSVNLLYHRLLTAQEGYSLAEARVLSEIKRKLEAKANVRKEQNSIFFKVDCPEGTEFDFEFENAEFDLLKRIFEGGRWTGPQVEEAIATEDWLKTAAPRLKLENGE